MRYGFGDFILDLGRRELRRSADLVSLAPQVFDLLEYLVRNSERTISKDELIEAIWGGRAISDAALTTRVHVARKAIGDSGTAQQFIKTLPRKGVRFVGAVTRLDLPMGAAATAARITQTSSPGVTKKPSIAVVAFECLPGDPVPEFIGKQLAEDLLSELTRFRWLNVLSWRASPPSRVDQAGSIEVRSADVRYLLHGSVQRHDGSGRIRARLTEVGSGLRLWGANFDTHWSRSLTDQDTIIEAIARTAVDAVLANERTRSLRAESSDLGAWEAYQRGLWLMSRGDASTIETARSCFQQAIDLDACLTAGYSGLAWATMMAASIYSSMTIAEGCEIGQALAQHALSLDHSDPDAKSRLALVGFLRGDIAGSIEKAENVLSSAPNCASAWGVKGAALISRGRHAEGRDAMNKFLRLGPNDPIRPVRLTQVATSYYLEGNYQAAATTARQITQRYPKHPWAYRWLAAASAQLGNIEEATTALHALRLNWPSSFEMYVVKQPPPFCSSEYKPLLAGLRKAGCKL